jgi:hypothetical protein
MVIHPREDALILGTHGRGILIIDDISPLRAVNAELLAKPFTFLPAKPQVVKSGGGFQDFSSEGEFVGDNPSGNAKIMYYMAKRHMVGDMKMYVYDDKGKEVSELIPGKQRGINVTEWITRLEPPKAKMGTTLSGGAFIGPSLPEGTYTVKVIKGKEEFSTTIELAGDPRSLYPKEERLLQQQTVLRLYALTERMGKITETLQYWISEAGKAAEKEQKLSTKIAPVKAKFDAFNKTLISTDKAGVFAGDEQLNEKIIELYGNVNSFPGKPSQSQLDLLAFFEKETDAAEARFRQLADTDLTVLNKMLTGSGMEALQKEKKPEALGESAGKKYMRRFFYRMGWLH